ncbi:MAG TPA: hypothetical protein VJ728_12390 [Candidatus Binataceae bacterium]|nr:hypothetical protein [Candidatus Binataceae bacterium]
MPQRLFISILAIDITASVLSATVLTTVPGPNCVGDNSPSCPGSIETLTGDPGTFLASTQPDGTAIWEEEDYCSPPLAQERTAVLDMYFDEIEVEQVKAGEGWKRINSLPKLNANR